MTENIFRGFFAALVEPIHVELADETVDVSVPEVLGEDSLLELLNVFDGKLFAISRPLDNSGVLVILELNYEVR